MASLGQAFQGQLQRFNEQPGTKKAGLLAGAALFVALLAGAWSYSTAPEYRTLFNSLSDKDGGDIVTKLAQMNVPYKVSDGGGSIQVPADQVYDIRLKLASQGLPKGGTVGFEVMENEKFGTSQFQEQVNYQRALEGELARSIQSISAISAARVHLALPQQSVFMREQQKPSASVLVTLYPGRTLDDTQVQGVTRLITSSVPNLSDNNVSIIDQQGKLLNRPRHGSLDGLNDDQLYYRQQVEQNYVNHIETILLPIAGFDNVRAQVSVDMDFSHAAQTAETYKPNTTPGSATLRSTQTSESKSSTPSPVGIPGALSNQPPGETIPTYPGEKTATATAAPENTQKEATTNYEVNKAVRTTEEPAGAIRRVTAAVIINQHQVVNKDGSIKMVPLTATEMAQINDLVKQAIGYSVQRGDSVNIVNAAFSKPADVATPVPFWANPVSVNLAKNITRYALTALVVLAMFFGLRRWLKPAAPETPEGQAGDALLALPPGEAGAPGALGALAAEESQAQQLIKYEENLNAVKDIARQNPALVASVVKDWIENA